MTPRSACLRSAYYCVTVIVVPAVWAESDGE